MKTRILSMLLAVLMIVTAIPAMTIFSFAEEQTTSESVTYDDLYARQDNMLAQIDFFGAKAPEEEERVTITGTGADLKDYIIRGNTLKSDGTGVNKYAYTLSSSSPAVYLADGYLKLTHDGKDGTEKGGIIRLNTDLENATVMTYQYVTAVDEFEGTIDQALSSTAGRIYLAIDGNDYVYPKEMQHVITTSTASTRPSSTRFIKDDFGTLPKIGESFTVTQTMNVTSEGEEGHVYVNLAGQAYSQPFVEGDYLNAYSSIGTSIGANDTMRIYALRAYNVILTDDEIAQNNLIDIAKFYSLDIDKVKNILALDDEIKSVVLNNLYSIKLTRTKTDDGAAAEFDAIIEESLKEYYYESKGGHLAEMYTFYDVSALDYALLDDAGKAFVDSMVEKWTLDTFTGEGTEPQEKAQAELDKYIKWTKIDYSAYDEMPARYKRYIRSAIEAINYDSYADNDDPAAKAQEDINNLVAAYQFDLSQYNKLPASYKLKVDALVAEFDIEEITSADNAKAAAQAAFDSAIKEAVNDYESLYVEGDEKQNNTVALFKQHAIDLYDYVRLDDTQKKAVADVIGEYSVSDITAEKLQQLLKSTVINASDYYVTDGLIAYFNAEQYISKYPDVPTEGKVGTADKLDKSIIWYNGAGNTITYGEDGKYVSGMFYYDSILDDPKDGLKPYASHTVDMLVRPTKAQYYAITTGFEMFNIVNNGGKFQLRHDASSWRYKTPTPSITMYVEKNLNVLDGEGTNLPFGEIFNFAIRTSITEQEATAADIANNYPEGTFYDTAMVGSDKKYDGYYKSVFTANNYAFQDRYISFAYDTSTTAHWAFAGRNYGTNVMVGGVGLDVYRVRVYNRALTDAELAQNHFSDVAYYYGIDVLGFDKIPEAYRTQIIDTFKTVSFDNTYTLEELQTMYDDLAYPEVEGDSLAGTEDIVNFRGYSTRQSSFAGIRATFSYDPEEIKALEEEGYSVEMGVIMAIAKEGRTPDDLALINNGEKFVAAGSQMLASSVYKDGNEVGNITEIEHPDSENPQRTHQFVYAITYQAASSQTAAMYALDCMYRAFLIATKDGISYITYYDCESGLFGDEISVYELSTYWMYEQNLDNSIIKGVISTAGYSDDAVEYYNLYKTSQEKFDKYGVEALPFDELNQLYNVQLKAKKDALLALRLKYYEAEGKATDVDGNIDICGGIDALIEAYTTKHGVDVEFYEITDATGSVYFDVTTEKDPHEYVYGDDITFTVTLRDKKEEKQVSCSEISYSYTIDGVSEAKSGKALAALDGTFTFTISKEEYAVSTLADDANSTSQGILIHVQASASDVAQQEKFEGGVVIDMENIKASAEKPVEYDTFWDGQLAAIKNINPTDTTPASYTGDGVVISDIRRANDENNIGVYSEAEGNTISEDNYFHIVQITEERLTLLQDKGLHKSIDASTLDSYNVYEVYLKSAGPTPSVGILSIPKTLTASTGIVITFDGYGAHAPSIIARGSNIQFNVSHSGYWADATDAELYKSLNDGILSAYGKAISGKENSGYEDVSDNYILYMFLRNLQAVRFLTELPEIEENTEIATAVATAVADIAGIDDATASSLEAIYGALLDVKELSGELIISINGSSMGGFQTFGTTALAERFGIDIYSATPKIPAFCNLAGVVEGGRLDDIFGIGYHENMLYFDPVFFAEYITANVTIGRCGLGDYTCPPSGIIATYNALKSKKSITFYQNSTHSYYIEDDSYKFTVTAPAQE